MKARTAILTTVTSAAAVVVLAGGGTASAGGGCFHGTGPSDGTGTTVEMIDACFTPTVLHVDPGTEVTFVNRDDTAHQVTGVGDSWGSFDELLLDERARYRFDEEGVYLYSCFIHPGMIGAVVAGSGEGDAGLEPASVTGGTVAEVPPADDAATVRTPSPQGESGATEALTVAGVAALAIGGGLTVAAVRRRRTSPLAEPTGL